MNLEHRRWTFLWEVPEGDPEVPDVFTVFDAVATRCVPAIRHRCPESYFENGAVMCFVYPARISGRQIMVTSFDNSRVLLIGLARVLACFDFEFQGGHVPLGQLTINLGSN